MWEILLNSILNGWLKWVVLLTKCKWAVVNSIRIKNGLYILTNRKWAISSLPHTCGPTKLTRPLKKEVDAYARLCQLITVNTRFYQQWPLDVHPTDVVLLLQSRIF